MADTSLRVSEALADELYDRKERGESYEDVIWRLIEQADGDDGDQPTGQSDPPAAPTQRAVADDELLDAYRTSLSDRPPKTSHGREAVVTTLAVLREDGPLPTGELQGRVFARLDAEAWDTPRAMWQSIQRYMGDVDDPVAGIEKVAYGEWDYAGDDAVWEALGE